MYLSTQASLDRTPYYADIEPPDKILAELTARSARGSTQHRRRLDIHTPRAHG